MYRHYCMGSMHALIKLLQQSIGQESFCFQTLTLKVIGPQEDQEFSQHYTANMWQRGDIQKGRSILDSC